MDSQAVERIRALARAAAERSATRRPRQQPEARLVEMGWARVPLPHEVPGVYALAPLDLRFPAIVKVGRSNRLRRRITGVRLGFPVELALIGAIVTEDVARAAELEHAALVQLQPWMLSRSAGRTEWFDCSSAEARAVLAGVFGVARQPAGQAHNAQKGRR